MLQITGTPLNASKKNLPSAASFLYKQNAVNGTIIIDDVAAG